MIDEDDISEDEDDDHDDVIYLVTSLLSSTGLCYQCITLPIVFFYLILINTVPMHYCLLVFMLTLL